MSIGRVRWLTAGAGSVELLAGVRLAAAGGVREGSGRRRCFTWNSTGSCLAADSSDGAASQVSVWSRTSLCEAVSIVLAVPSGCSADLEHAAMVAELLRGYTAAE